MVNLSNYDERLVRRYVAEFELPPEFRTLT